MVLAQTLALVLRFLSGYDFVAQRLKSDAVYFETDERRPRSEQGLQVGAPVAPSPDQMHNTHHIGCLQDMLTRPARTRGCRGWDTSAAGTYG